MDVYQDFLKFMFCSIFIGVVLLNGIGAIASTERIQMHEKVKVTKIWGVYNNKKVQGRKRFVYSFKIHQHQDY